MQGKFEPNKSSSKEIISKSASTEDTLQGRFKAKAAELAREGFFGSLKSKKDSLKTAFANLVSLLDQPALPVLLYGEQGAGKRRLIDEYLVLQNFSNRLEGGSTGTLRVLKSSFLQPGWTLLLSPQHNRPEDFVYVENVENLRMDLQTELLVFLKKRATNPAFAYPRIVFGTEKALSMQMLQKNFDRGLFKELTRFGIFLPSLNERSEDHLDLIVEVSHKITGKTHRPPAWFVDFCTHQLWGRNLDELELLLKNMFIKKPKMSRWVKADLPRLYYSPSTSFKRAEPKDITHAQKFKTKLLKALHKHHGNHQKVAHELGVTKLDLLQKMFSYGVR